MKISTIQILKNFRGEDMQMSVTEIVNGKEEVILKPMVLREIVTNILNMEDKDNRLTAEKKTQAFQIMKKLWESNEVELSLNQKAFIADRAKLFLPTMTAGLIEEALEGVSDTNLVDKPVFNN